MASVRPTVPDGAESSGEYEVSWCGRFRRDAREVYIFNRSWAKIDASEPPAPGWISRRQGKALNGCGGIRDCLSVLARIGREDLVVSRSVEARSRSSVSVEGSERRDSSSTRDCRC